jgi:hypothetical protein
VRIKLKVHWRLQEVTDVRNVECLLRKVAGSKQSQPERVIMWVATRRL